MRSSGIRDDVAPWSFFLPVTLAVIVGVVAAGLVGRGIDAVFDKGDREDAPAAPTVRGDVGPAPQPDPGPGLDDRGPEAVVEAPPAAPTPSAPSPPQVPETGAADASLPTLPGATVARRDGAAEACINGTVALRDDNGWQQRLENDAPVPCIEQSATR